MLTPPADLPEAAILAALDRNWGLAVDAISYQPVGFGSHHWTATRGPQCWFVTVDELDTKQYAEAEPLDAPYERLCAALATARALHDRGHAYPVAPIPMRDGAPVVRLGARFAVAVYPFVAGRGFDWGDFDVPGHREAILELVIALHGAPEEVRRHALADDFAVPHRDELIAALRTPNATPDHGPYARPAAALLAEHAAAVQDVLDRYDALVAAIRAEPARAVLTHGEPHRGNTMLTATGWRLIDWETALVAPPERDLWMLDPGDGSVVRAYELATGVELRPAALALYRLRWDIADIAVDLSRFRRPHTGTVDDAKSWGTLQSLVTRLSPGAGT
jgi:Phosphotransferase enzyme family